jgi:ketosteroid isomerase-like protein
VFSAEDHVAIKSLHEAWLNAELRGDSSALLQFCTAAPVWLPPNEAPLCGSEAILRWLAHQSYGGVRTIDIDDLAIFGIDAFAWKLATFRTTLNGPAHDGAGIVIAGSHAWMLQHNDAGVWQIGVVAWTIAESRAM